MVLLLLLELELPHLPLQPLHLLLQLPDILLQLLVLLLQLVNFGLVLAVHVVIGAAGFVVVYVFDHGEEFVVVVQ